MKMRASDVPNNMSKNAKSSIEGAFERLDEVPIA